jgi:hypothetical protein
MGGGGVIETETKCYNRLVLWLVKQGSSLHGCILSLNVLIYPTAMVMGSHRPISRGAYLKCCR